jgi:hypothetical protein
MGQPPTAVRRVGRPSENFQNILECRVAGKEKPGAVFENTPGFGFLKPARTKSQLVSTETICLRSRDFCQL